MSEVELLGRSRFAPSVIRLVDADGLEVLRDALTVSTSRGLAADAIEW